MFAEKVSGSIQLYSLLHAVDHDVHSSVAIYTQPYRAYIVIVVHLRNVHVGLCLIALSSQSYGV